MTMVMRTISASQFKAKCLAILDEVAEGDEVIVTKRGHPVAKVVPIEASQGDLRGSVTQLVSDEELMAPFDDWELDRELS